MPRAIIANVTQTVQVNGGPSLSEISSYDCDSYEVIEVSLPGPTTKKEVVIQGVGSEMSLLQISVPDGVYGTAPHITYQLLSNAGLAIDLTNMHQFVGRGAIQALMDGQGDAEITKIYFTNADTSARTVRILVGKDVTP